MEFQHYHIGTAVVLVQDVLQPLHCNALLHVQYSDWVRLLLTAKALAVSCFCEVRELYWISNHSN